MPVMNWIPSLESFCFIIQQIPMDCLLLSDSHSVFIILKCKITTSYIFTSTTLVVLPHHHHHTHLLFFSLSLSFSFSSHLSLDPSPHPLLFLSSSQRDRYRQITAHLESESLPRFLPVKGSFVPHHCPQVPTHVGIAFNCWV